MASVDCHLEDGQALGMLWGFILVVLIMVGGPAHYRWHLSMAEILSCVIGESMLST